MPWHMASFSLTDLRKIADLIEEENAEIERQNRKSRSKKGRR